MKGVVFTTDEKLYVKDFGEPLYKTVGKAVGGYIEIVHPERLESPFVLIANEEGRIHQLPFNIFASAISAGEHCPCGIVGNVVVMKEGIRNGEEDIVGLTEDEINEIISMACEISDGTIEIINQEEVSND